MSNTLDINRKKLNGKQKTQWLEAIYKEMNKRDFEEGNCTN
jgi:hypothetical protein